MAQTLAPIEPVQRDSGLVDSAPMSRGEDGRGPQDQDPRADDAGEPDSPARTRGLSPGLFAYVIGPLALVPLFVFWRIGLVARIPFWQYPAAIAIGQMASRYVERWPDATRGSLRLHARVVVHVAAVTSVIYMSGWGPALGVAFVFSALADLHQSGAGAWRASLGWSLIGLAIGQLMVFEGVAPSFLSQAQAQGIGALGAFVWAISIQLSGAIGERKEHAEQLLAEETRRAAVARDEAQRSRDEARRSEAHHRAVVENAAEGILTVSADGTIRSFNAAAEAMFGWRADEILGRSATAIVPPELHEYVLAFAASALSDDPSANERRDIELTGVRRDGSFFPAMVSASSINVEGSEPVISAIFRNLTDQKAFEAQLEHQVLHDSLTSLPNRVMLIDRLEQALARLRRQDGMFAVMFIDLDRFKSINDAFGHTAGDQLLVEAARRIAQQVREVDTVARIAGDEFIVLCEQINGVHDATNICDRLIEALQAPVQIGDEEVRVGASVGIALCTDGAESADSLVSNADLAMYRAKQNGRGRYELFDETMQLWITTRLALEHDLQRAIERDELRLVYQPVVVSDTGEIRGFEALIRWERPGFGLVGPNEFIPVAEETGLIVDIGAWVLEEACRRAVEWNRRWPDRYLGVSVNVSGRQLLAPDFLERVVTILGRTGVNPALVTFELTESMLIDDPLTAEALLRGLRALGCNLALDDFGTGYSSLTYLKTFPINFVKIDKSFVSTIGSEREGAAIVAAVISLAETLGLSVVAEGVEELDQRVRLEELGCPYMQGYYFARPQPPTALAALIEAKVLGVVPLREGSAHSSRA